MAAPNGSRLGLAAAGVLALLVVVVLALGGGEPPSATPDVAAATHCPGTAGTTPRDPWAGVLSLQSLGRTDDARKAAVRVLGRTGTLPADPAACATVEKLLTPAEPDGLTAFTAGVGDWLKEWWWAASIVLLLLVALAGWVVRRSWWRTSLPWPEVTLSVAETDDDATGHDVGTRVSALVRAQLLQLDPNSLGPWRPYAGLGDAVVAGPPLDELPAKVKWFVALWQWLAERNGLTFALSLVQSRAAEVALVGSFREPTGAPTRDAHGAPRATLIPRPCTPGAPTDEDYLRLAVPALAWGLFQAKEVTGDTADLPDRLGTGSWEAYSRFLEGTAALDRGEVASAREHFRRAGAHDPSPRFLELRLNRAYGQARTDDVDLWSAALTEFTTLADTP